jgi:hypothetical protein
MEKPAQLLLCTTVLGLIGVACFLPGGSEPPPGKVAKPLSIDEILAINDRAEELDAEAAAFRRVRQTRVRVLRELLDGGGLREAAEELYRAASTYYPKYLKWLSAIEPGATGREQVAKHLIAHIETAIDYGEYPLSTVTVVWRLRAELASAPFRAWCADAADRGKAGRPPASIAAPDALPLSKPARTEESMKPACCFK